MGVAQKLSSIPELIKLENTLFVLPFTYIGMLLAGIPSLAQFLLITIALVCARGAAFAVNRLAGHGIDMNNPKKRNWSSVRLYAKRDMALIAALFVAVFMACAFMLNALAFVLAPIIVILLVLEPYTKRYTQHRHFTMGLIIGLGIFGGYIGMAGSFPTQLPIYVLLAGYALFSGANDIIYTLNHVQHDIENRLKTYPSRYGIATASIVSEQAHYSAALMFVLFGYMLGSALVVMGAFLAFILLFMEHRRLSRRDENSVRVSFFNYNVAVSLAMLLFVILSRLI